MLWLANSWSRALSWRQPDVHLAQIPGIGGEGPKENSGRCLAYGIYDDVLLPKRKPFVF